VLWLRGITWLVVLPLLAVWLLASGRNSAANERELSWCRGRWSLTAGESNVPLHLDTRATQLPWVIYAPFTLGDGRGCALWLMRDAMSAQQWRQLRVRFTLSDAP